MSSSIVWEQQEDKLDLRYIYILRDNMPCCQVDSSCFMWGLSREILVKFIITMVMLKKHNNIIINITGILTPQPDSFQTIFIINVHYTIFARVEGAVHILIAISTFQTY